MIKIGFSGTPGSGKTSTARGLASMCRRNPKLKNVELVPEYARRYLAKYDIDSLWEQIRIANKQMEWENSIPESVDLLITDSPIFLSFVYAIDIRNKNPDDAKNNLLINDLFKILNKNNLPARYDIVFHFPPKIKPVDDGIRPSSNFDDAWRNKTNQQIINCFEIFKPKKFIIIEEESMEDRLEVCMKAIEEL